MASLQKIEAVPLEPVEPGERRLWAAESDERDRLGDELGVVGALAQLSVARVQVAVHVRRRLREQSVEPHPSLYFGVCSKGNIFRTHSESRFGVCGLLVCLLFSYSVSHAGDQ